MKMQKITVEIKIEVLSVDVVPGLLYGLAEQYSQEKIHGSLHADDGDLIQWETKQTEVEL